MRRAAARLGSGVSPTPGFTHLDTNPHAPKVDIVGSAYPLPDEVRTRMWHEIRAVDVLEHLSYRVVEAALDEWASVLWTGGRLFVQVPDAEEIMRTFVKLDNKRLPWTREGQECSPLEGAEWRLLGGHADGCYVGDDDDWKWNAHYSFWSATSIYAALSGRVPRHPY